MKFLWFSNAANAELIEFLKAELAGLKEERKVLLDRLATLGLGGPLFALDPLTEPVEEHEENPDPEQAIVEQLMQLRRRPTQLADALTRRSRHDFGKRSTRPKVAWIPKEEKIEAALDEAEALGKKSATESF